MNRHLKRFYELLDELAELNKDGNQRLYNKNERDKTMEVINKIGQEAQNIKKKLADGE